MNNLEDVLLNMGCNLAAAGLYDLLKKIFQSSPELTRDEFKTKLQEGLLIHGVDKVEADGLIEFLARNGDIKISFTKISAGSILYQSSKGKIIELAAGVVSETDETSISTGSGNIKASGRSFMKQDKQNITFSA